MIRKNKFTVRLLSHDFRVFIDSPTDWDVNGMGRASLKDQTIHLNDVMPDDVRHSTLLHEIVHLISDLNSIELSNIQVDVVAQGIFTLIKDNPDLMSNICGINIKQKDNKE